MLKLEIWRFKITLFCVLMLCFVIAQSEEKIRKGKKGYKTKPGYVKLKTETSKGRQIMEMNIDGKTHDVELEKKELPVISKPPSQLKEDVSMYLSQDGSTACMKECKHKTTKCKAQCLRKNINSYTYVSGNNAMDVESDSTLTADFDNTIMTGPRREALMKKANTKHQEKERTKRSTLMVPNRNTNTATIKVKLLLNDDVMKIFQEFVGGNASEAKAEAECYFTLAMNRVEMLYSSISGRGVSFKTADNFTKPLDMSVWLHSIDSPPIVDNTFSSIAPLKDNYEDGDLITKYYFNASGDYLYEDGVSIDFAEYMRETYNATTSFNQLQVITGYELWYEFHIIHPDGSIVFYARFQRAGFAATIGALCENFEPLDMDLRYSFVSLYAPEFPRLMAHEIGHIAGAYHDEPGRCDDEVYVMNPIIYQKYPNYPAASYYSFSVCSVEDFASYLSRFTSGELASCLYTSSPSETEFLSNFCKGFPGSKYGIETYCEIFVDNNSTICPNGDYTFENGYLPWDGCEIKEENNTFFAIFYCTDENGCENTNNYIAQIFEGTKCLNEDGTEGDKVCYRGKCSTEQEICDDYEEEDEEEEDEEEDESKSDN